MKMFNIQQDELNTIAGTIELTTHAKDRLKERFNITDIEILKKMIKQPYKAWNNTDGTISIAFSNEYYIVVQPKPNKYVVITAKEPSKNGISVDSKYDMALKGKKWKKGDKKNGSKR